MNHILKQIWRGAGPLHYVGEHPGTMTLIVLSIVGTCAGGGLGFAIMFGVFAPVYFWGCYDRAETHDRLEAQQQRKDRETQTTQQ